MSEASLDPAETIAARAARNQSAFRDANERIESVAENLAGLELVPFVCECPRRDCTALLRLMLAEYEEIRGSGARFVVVPGHETTHLDGVEIAVVAGKHDRFSVMEKVGEAGELASQRDPRSIGSRDG